ncbi:MAG: YggS family pyridoxal phosphate-dependent enzyme [Actinomycetota bacterium]|nr:YggS family pyridoxal phosphate-dependent enzyme [Actinomycetota bacterium]
MTFENELSREQLLDRAGALRERVSALGGDQVEIVAVTKGFGSWALRLAVECGFKSVGENYAQELKSKWGDLNEDLREAVNVHFIGGMQTNKVRKVADIVNVWQTVDRSSLVQELSKRCPGSSVMVQVNLAENESQGGCHMTEAGELISLATSAGLEVTGLMAIGPQGDAASIRNAYRDLVLLADDQGLHHRSIGMSNDLEIAIESGSTMVRIGTALFGDRPIR